MKSLLLTIVALIIILTSACGYVSDTEQLSLKLINPRIGLYAIDGTTKTATDRTIIYQMLERYRGPVRSYSAGTDIFAINADDIVLDVVGAICNDFLASRIDGFSVIGYSRGAVMVNEVARKVIESGTYVPCTISGRKPIFFWAGMLDAVDTNIWHMSKVVPPAVRLMHRVKFVEWQGVFTTVNFVGTHYKSRGGPAFDHGKIGYDPDSLQYLIDDAQDNVSGMSFW